MENRQVEQIQLFLKRPRMYVMRLDKESVVAFIDGFEIGCDGASDLTQKLSEWVENKYRIKRAALGWSYQIERYSEKRSISWFDGFKELVEELLTDEWKSKN